ncbi:hypothetical protein GRJ2_003393900 [Grus japonensis]|uniref:ribonuclease H n=1 Tax=Grus japonensis TaxID=30415 RepID=A0ABC9YI79_GRUJA
MPSNYEGVEPISISGVTGGSQQLTLLEAEVSLTGNEWQKHPIVTGPEAPCILGIDYLRRGYFKDPKAYWWAFGIAALEAEEIEPLSSLPGLSEDPSVVGLLRVEEQQVPIATTAVHRRQYRTNRDSLVPIHELIHQLEGQGVISRTRSPFNSPIWPVRKSNGEWRLTVDYRGLNEVTPLMNAALPDMLELQYDLESKAAKWYTTIDIANAFFSIPLAAECRPQFAFTWRGLQYTWNRLPQGWKHSPTICHGLIQSALEKGEAPEHLQYIDDIIVWGNSAEEVPEKGKNIGQILLKAGFAIKRKAAEGEGELSQFAEVKAIQLALDIAEREKWPTLYLYIDSWMVANALWGWLQQWKRSNWQHRGKPIWAAPLWQDIAARLEKLVVKVCHVDAHIPKSRATEEHQNNQQVDQAAKIEVAQVDLDWQHKGEMFIAHWAHDTSGHQGRDVTYRWARDRGVDLSMEAISQVIHQCETCAAIKQAKQIKPLCYGGEWLKYQYGEAWQIDYITLPQTCQGKSYQVLWRHGTPERIESDNGTHFQNNLIDTWAKEHGIEWVYHIPYHAPDSGKIESPIWPVRKSNGEWRLTVDYRGLNEVTPPMSAAVPDMLELQYDLESKAAKWYATIDIANAFFSIPLAAECRPLFAFTWRGLQYTWNELPQGWKHSPTICHGLIQTGLEKGEAPEHLQYIDDIIVWGNSAEEVPEKGKNIGQILLKAGFAIKRIAEAAEGEGESSQFAEVKAIQLALDIAEREKWPMLYLYIDSWMVANALWGWLQQWKRSNWQHRGKPIWAAPLWQDIAAQLEKLVVKVHHVDAHVPKSRATEEHQNNQQVNQAAKIEVAQVDLDWQHKGELFIARWAHDTSGHQGRDGTYRWACDRGVDLSMEAISQVIHQCETCAAIKQAKQIKPLCYGGEWLKYQYGEAWQIDYITLPQTHQGKRYILTMVEATTRLLDRYPGS